MHAVEMYRKQDAETEETSRSLRGICAAAFKQQADESSCEIVVPGAPDATVHQCLINDDDMSYHRADELVDMSR